MDQPAFRAIGAAIVIFLLAQQALRAVPGSRRRRAFWLGAAAFIVVALFNAAAAFGITAEPLGYLALTLGSVLIITSMWLLLQAYRHGEMDAQFRHARDVVDRERARVRRK